MSARRVIILLLVVVAASAVGAATLELGLKILLLAVVWLVAYVIAGGV